MGVSFLLMLLPLPLLFIWLWRKKGFSLNSFFSGVTVFVVFYLVLRHYVVSLLSEQGGQHIISFVLAALVVELGRYSGFSILSNRVKNRLDISVGLSLGLGYVTGAFLLINAFNMAMNLIYGAAINNWGILGEYLNQFPQESVDQVQMLILGTHAYSYLRETLFLYLTIPGQLLFSLLVFESFRRKQSKGGRLLFLGGAIVGDMAYFSLGSLIAPLGSLVQFIFLFLVALVSLGVIWRFWKGEMVILEGIFKNNVKGLAKKKQI